MSALLGHIKLLDALSQAASMQAASCGANPRFSPDIAASVSVALQQSGQVYETAAAILREQAKEEAGQ